MFTPGLEGASSSSIFKSISSNPPLGSFVLLNDDYNGKPPYWLIIDISISLFFEKKAIYVN